MADEITCLIADDHEVVREGLRLALSRSARIRVIGEASDGASAVALAERRRPDVVIMDLRMPDMDGLEALQNVVVIIASNRADLIDPAILRPGRIDRKIRVRRPDKEAAREIYKIYLQPDLPLAEARDDLVTTIVDAHYAHSEENRFLDVSYRSGRHDYLYRGDLSSGAIIAAIVERAKEYAIKRSIEKLRFDGDVVAEIAGNGFSPLDMSVAHAVRAGALPPHHRDPFDRMLVAQAQAEGLTLVTRDRHLEAYDVDILRC